MFTFRLQILFFVIAYCLFFNSCKKEDEPSEKRTEMKKQVIKTYSDIVYNTYRDAYEKVLVLQQKVQQLTANPSQQALNEARQAYRQARLPYEQSESFRFYGGPVDGDNGVEGMINGWPLDESYIDYVAGKADAGIINNPALYPVISKQVLAALNEQGGETNLSTGFHAIEFLLWGQDRSATSAGQRPYTDYVSGAGVSAANQQRRAQYLLAVTELLAEHLQYLVTAWTPGTAYYASFTSANPDSSLHKILFGLGSLSGGELAGERMKVAYETQDQEDEHSCFSDLTHEDLYWSQISIMNIYQGRYQRSDGSLVSGTGLGQLLAAQNPALHQALSTTLDESKTYLADIPVPFDQAIINSNGRAKVLKAMQSLQKQTDQLVEAANALGIKLHL